MFLLKRILKYLGINSIAKDQRAKFTSCKIIYYQSSIILINNKNMYIYIGHSFTAIISTLNDVVRSFL